MIIENIFLGKNVDVSPDVKLNNVTIGDNTRVRDYTIIFGSKAQPAKIGKDCYIGAYCYLQGFFGLEIGNNVTFAAGVMVFSNSGPNASKKLQKVYPIKKGKIVIGDDVWICAGAKILPGVTIGSGSVVAANSVVAKDVPEGVVVGGTPARVLKSIE